jgi:hypothetical protein
LGGEGKEVVERAIAQVHPRAERSGLLARLTRHPLLVPLTEETRIERAGDGDHLFAILAPSRAKERSARNREDGAA